MVGREKEGELATTSPEFEYLHRKSHSKMLISGDDITNDIITFGACFYVFFNVCLQLYICALSASRGLAEI